ncbi:MAG: hypothetical protein JWP88_1107 [Flaviaesturariibacter sp.]|nr:hypothetical protein [Flaviaesturariibacter sp.]
MQSRFTKPFVKLRVTKGLLFKESQSKTANIKKITMKKVLLLISLITSHLVFAQPANDLIRNLKTKLDKVTDYQATAQMDIDVAFINAPKSDVVVYYKRPDQFKVVKKGGISVLPKGGVSVNLSSLLFANNYTVVDAGTATVAGMALKVIKLLPLDEKSDVVITTLYVDDKALLIRKTAVTTKENGSYEMEMGYGKYAAYGLPDKVVFSFSTKEYKLPKGVTFDYDKGGSKKIVPKGDGKGRVVITYTSYTINKGVDPKVFKS